MPILSFWRKEQSFDSAGNLAAIPGSSGPYPSHYTNWDIPAPMLRRHRDIHKGKPLNNTKQCKLVMYRPYKLMNQESPPSTWFSRCRFTHTTTQSIHFYFRCTGRRGTAIPIISTPSYAWDNSTLLCNQTHDPLKRRSETKFHTVWGYPLHIWFTEKKCSLVFVTGSETRLQYSHCLHPVPRHNKVRRCENKMYGTIRGVCVCVCVANRPREAYGIPWNRVLCTITNATWDVIQFAGVSLRSVTHHTPTMFVSGWHKVHNLRRLVLSINQLQKS